MVARMPSTVTTSVTTRTSRAGTAAAADNEQLALKWALVFEFLWQKLEVLR